MNYQELWKEDNAAIRERYELALERIKMIREEHTVSAELQDYFIQAANVVEAATEYLDFDYRQYSMEELEAGNQRLYGELQAEAYEKSYANPQYAEKQLGDNGKVLSFLYTELLSLHRYARESRCSELTIHMELLIEIYNLYEDQDAFDIREVQKAIYYFYYDYCDVLVPDRTQEMYDARLDRYVQLIEQADLSDLRYLYGYGEAISTNEIRTAQYMNQLSQEEIDRLAFVYTDGYREGFEIAGIDLSKKKYVNLHYAVGQERMIRAAIRQFRELGLEPIIFLPAVSRLNQRQNRRNGVVATPVNRQYDYDHRYDEGIYLDSALMERKLEVLEQSYETYREFMQGYAGPAVVETFGEAPFEPIEKPESIALTKKQQDLTVEYTAQAGRLVNRYINRETYSFTIIAYPSPEIGNEFEEIFRETTKINTLDKKLYRTIQEIMINELNQAEFVRVQGIGKNRTDMKVMMHIMEHPERETNFENCLADVNIPVGEVFTSPRLTGTEGCLNVSEVYLNDLKFVDLELHFKDGKITDYTCGNFDQEEANIRFVKENLLQNRETLPIGEFAIGTNTTAYVMANRYQIVYKLPILIVEKMGPHFAVGDTCYSYSEENRLFNPDGKEIVTKDNECSILRKEDESKAYFHCHTDITIPYAEIGSIRSVHADGTEVEIMRNGRFVLPGTEELNRPLDEAGL
ncbi:MAG: aminopeptidase [Lachnospiraceae bacterium]|nr:aminopeptidase [Lachnospiraceae bacterium]